MLARMLGKRRAGSPREPRIYVESMRMNLPTSRAALRAVPFESLEPRVLLSGGVVLSDIGDAVPGPGEIGGDIGGTVIGGEAIFAGFCLAPIPSLVPSGAVAIYHQRTGRWSRSTEPDPATVPGATSVGNLAFFAGGYLGVSRALVSDNVNIYDAATGQWSTPSLSYAAQHIAATSVPGKAIFAGGSLSYGVTSDVDIYDVSSQEWSTSSLSSARTDIAAVSIGGLALFAGGTDLQGNPTATVDIYDSESGQWSSTAAPQAMGAAAGASVGDTAYFAYNGLLETYNVDLATWSTEAMPEELFNATATRQGNLVLFVGNPSTTTVSIDIAEAYDTVTGSWTVLPLSRVESSPAAVSLGSSSLIVGLDPTRTLGKGLDIVTNETAVAQSLGGRIALGRRGSGAVTLTNPTTDVLSARYKEQVYASTSQSLDTSAVLVASATVRRPLGAGETLNMTLPLSIPTGTPAGQYHLILVAGLRGAASVVASQRKTFTIAGPAASENASAQPAPAAAPASSTSPFFSPSNTTTLDFGDTLIGG